MSKGTPTPSNEDLAARLRAAGLRATANRVAILGAVNGHWGHPAAEEVWEDLRPGYPTLSLSTVIRLWKPHPGRFVRAHAGRRWPPARRRHATRRSPRPRDLPQVRRDLRHSSSGRGGLRGPAPARRHAADGGAPRVRGHLPRLLPTNELRTETMSDKKQELLDGLKRGSGQRVGRDPRCTAATPAW